MHHVVAHVEKYKTNARADGIQKHEERSFRNSRNKEIDPALSKNNFDALAFPVELFAQRGHGFANKIAEFFTGHKTGLFKQYPGGLVGIVQHQVFIHHKYQQVGAV